MRYLVSTEFFYNEMAIPGGDNPHLGVGQNLCYCISCYEPEYLIDYMLGYSLYKDMRQYLDADADNVPQKYADLIDGCEYQDCGITRYWPGLRKFTAMYIYYWYERMKFTRTGTTGQVIPVSENAATASPRDKMVTNYNHSRSGTRECRRFLSSRKDQYPQYDPSQLKHMGLMQSIY